MENNSKLLCFKWHRTADLRNMKRKKQLAFKTFKVASLRNTETNCGDKSVQILPPFAPCDWSVPVSVSGRGAPLISICLYVNLGLRLRSRVSLSAAADLSGRPQPPCRISTCIWSDETPGSCVYLLILDLWILLPLKTHPHTWVSWCFCFWSDLSPLCNKTALPGGGRLITKL